MEAVKTMFGSKESKTKSSGDRITYTIAGKKFQVDKRYKPMKKLGSGAYGVVVSASDKNTNDKVAIKKIEDVFGNLTDAKRILREVKLMQHLDHPNLLKLTDMIDPPTGSELEDIYMVTPFMQSDLHRIVYSENQLTLDHIQYVMYQVFCGLKYLHSAQIIHRDLKPSNILINEDCSIKICDFGLARGVTELTAEVELTEYVVTRWYRAPEVICSAQHYGYEIDIWAAGCILAELFLREPLFRGKSYVDQLNCIFEVLGTPSEDDMKCVTNAKASKYIAKLKNKDSVALSVVIPTTDENALDLLSKLLVFDPSKRMSVDEALAHPFFDAWRKEDDEKLNLCANIFDFSFEERINGRESLEDLLSEEVIKFRPN